MPEKVVNINKAKASELTRLVHIGPKRAELIIEFRTKVKKFKDLMELSSIQGLGVKRMEDIKKQGLVTF